MPRRHILSARQRSALLDLPTDEAALLRHYILADDDLIHIERRRRAENRIGFALQLCALRYPGRALAPGELIPQAISAFLGAQLGIPGEALVRYAVRRQTRQQHMEALRRIYGYRMFPGQGRHSRAFRQWLVEEAEQAHSNEDLARRFVARCRDTMTILPAISTIERLCADALVAAEGHIEARIVGRLDAEIRKRLNALLTEVMPGNVSRFVWLRKFEVGHNSTAANRLLDRLEFLQGLGLSVQSLAGVPIHRIARLRRQGERYFTDGVRDTGANRRLAILAACVIEWEAAMADAVVETHDRIVGKTWREAKQVHETRIGAARTSVTDTLRAFTALGSAMIEARNDGVAIETALTQSPEWERLDEWVAIAGQLSSTMAEEPLAHVGRGYHRFRRYAPRMLRCLRIGCAPIAKPLFMAAMAIGDTRSSVQSGVDFLRPNSKWHRYLKAQEAGDGRLREVAILFHLRDAFRSGDIWLTHSRRYGDITQVLLPLTMAQEQMGRLTLPRDPHVWLEDRMRRLEEGLKRLGAAARDDTIPHGSIEDGELRIDRLTAAVPDEAEELILDL